jgi:hypothetical protein
MIAVDTVTHDWVIAIYVKEMTAAAAMTLHFICFKMKQLKQN